MNEEIQLFSNPKGRGPGGDKINFRKGGRIAFTSGFTNKYLQNRIKYCILTIPIHTQRQLKIGFLFQDDPRKFPNITPYTITWSKKSNTGVIIPKAWFLRNGIDPVEVAGEYIPAEQTVHRYGKVFFVTIPKITEIEITPK